MRGERYYECSLRPRGSYLPRAWGAKARVSGKKNSLSRAELMHNMQRRRTADSVEY